MDYCMSIKTCNVTFATALCYDISRKELITGFEDGGIVYWDLKAGRKVKKLSFHTSWITFIFYWEKMKTVVSTSHDGVVAFWQGLLLIEWTNFYQPIYSIAVIDSLGEILLGTGKGLVLAYIDIDRSNGRFLQSKQKCIFRGHNDVVKCLLQLNNRVFSAGFDGRIIVYDTSGKLEPTTTTLSIIHRAHNGIISCLAKAKTAENHTMVISGSFDRTVKMWNEDGQLLNVIENFHNPVISIAYIPTTKTFWVTSGTSQARIFDGYSATDVTEYCTTFANVEKEPFHLTLLAFCSDLNLIAGYTSHKYLYIWRYNSESSALTFKLQGGIQSLCKSSKSTSIIFSSDAHNHLLRWERKGQSHFTYSFHEEIIHDSVDERLLKCVEKRLNTQTFHSNDLNTLKANLPRTILLSCKKADTRLKYSATVFTRSEQKNRHHSAPHLKYLKTDCKQISNYQKTESLVINKFRGRNFLRMVYVDELDFLIAACEDGLIYIFGYDLKATKDFLVNACLSNQTEQKEEQLAKIINKYEDIEAKKSESHLNNLNDLLNSPVLARILRKLKGIDDIYTNEDNSKNILNSSTLEKERHSNPLVAMTKDKQTLETVSRHLFGMKCRHCLIEHRDSVTSLLLIRLNGLENTIILLSSGWDRRICIWDVQSGLLIDKYCDPHCADSTESEYVGKGAILDMAYNPELNIFACASSDWSVYVNKFSLTGSKMHLKHKLTGHRGSVNTILYKPTNLEHETESEWISGSDDCTIRIWTTNQNPECRLSLNTGGPIICLEMDTKRNLLLAGVDRYFKIYNPQNGFLYRVYKGHQDVVRSLLYLEQEDEYASVSADGQLKIWRSCKCMNTNQEKMKKSVEGSALAVAKAAAKRLSSNPAAAIGAAARAFSEFGKFRCGAECAVRQSSGK